MSRPDAVAVLQTLGFVSDIDFVCTAESPTSTQIQWLSVQTQPSEAALDAVTPAQITTARIEKGRAALVALITVRDQPTRRIIALLSILLAEFNLHALKTNAILDAIDGATTLASLKTAVAAIADYPQRTKAQLITALVNAINAGDGET